MRQRRRQRGLSIIGFLLVAAVVIVFALVEGLLIYITIRFRRRPTDTELPPQTHGSNPLEILWTIVPTITVTVLFIAALITLTDKYETAAASPTVTIDVTDTEIDAELASQLGPEPDPKLAEYWASRSGRSYLRMTMRNRKLVDVLIERALGGGTPGGASAHEENDQQTSSGTE